MNLQVGVRVGHRRAVAVTISDVERRSGDTVVAELATVLNFDPRAPWTVYSAGSRAT